MSGPPKPGDPPVAVEARGVRLPAKADDPASLAFTIERYTLSLAANEVGIRMKIASAVH